MAKTQDKILKARQEQLDTTMGEIIDTIENYFGAAQFEFIEGREATPAWYFFAEYDHRLGGSLGDCRSLFLADHETLLKAPEISRMEQGHAYANLRNSRSFSPTRIIFQTIRVSDPSPTQSHSR
jgi:hypothetical protein